MSDMTQASTASTTEPAEGQDVTEPAQPAPDDATTTQNTASDGDRATAREAARYRRRLRDTEAERDALAERVERMQRAEVERIAGARLSVGADVFTVTAATLADFFDEDGDVDPHRVRAAADELVRTRPDLAPRWPDMGGGRRGTTVPRASWHGLLVNR